MNTSASFFRYLILGLLILLPGSVALAATPASATLTETSGPITFEAGPFIVTNPTPVPQVDDGPQCFNPAQPCDGFILTVDLPAGYRDTHPTDIVRFSFDWDDAGAGLSDYDFYIFDGVVETTDGSQGGHADAATGDNPESTSLGVCQVQTDQLTVMVVPYTSSGETVRGTIELVKGDAPEDGSTCHSAPTFGASTPTAPGKPRYQNFYAPDGTAAQGGSGEANIGYNRFSGNIMLMSSEPVFRLTPPELLDPVLPEAGPALWQDVSPVVASVETLDPIMVTDPDTGRTFISNQTTGPEVLFAISDDDGEFWIQASISPPTGGVDHQTIGVGPYPPPLTGLNPAYPNAVYYCTQALYPDFCQRSDTGGLSFEPGVPANTGLTTLCGGLHGHVKVAPNGSVFLPNKGCGPTQGGNASEDGGVTWREFIVPDSAPSGSDPSMAFDSDGTAYFCYTDAEGAWVAVSHDNGNTWQPSVNIGDAVNVRNAVFPEAVAGDSGRVACGFLGTDVAGNSEGLDFLGNWYLFIAHSYDGGETWTTVNATPNDPVQGAGGICTGGLGCGSNRNLLDFNEVTMDDQGRVLFGYNDGCVSKTCRQSNGAQNDFVAYWTVARQYGGKSLLADFDPVEPAPPEMPYLDGKRNQWNTVLNWRAPNDNGSEITSYQVFRGDSAGNLAQIGSVTGTKRSFVDASQDTGVDVLYYQVVAVNDQGVSEGSNVLGLEVVVEIPEDICLAPGVTTLTDGSGDGVLPGFDMRSFQLSQSFGETGAGHLRFQINTDPGLPLQPVNSFWYVTFYTPDDLVHGVRMIYKESSPSAPVFETYQAGPNSSGAIDGRFVVDGSESAASGSYDYPSGTIVIDVPFSDLGLDAGDLLRGFNGGSVEFAELPTGGGAAHVIDEMPNGLGRSGSQTLSTPEECAGATNQPPVAVLMADPRSGDAPLAVNFDGGASFDPDSGDSVVSYTFDFNDGSAPVTQASPVATHTYENPSNYKPTLTVTDSHGLASNNAAEVVIQVAEPEVITVVDDDDPAVEYTKGWHRRSDPAASDGGYHRRLGATGGGDAPTARLVFEGDEVTYYFGASEDGGSAELYLDGTLRTTIDYSGSAPGKAPEFGREITFSELGEGSHEFLLVFTSGAAYVDGFEVVSGADGGADESAAKTQSETTTSEGQLSLFGASVVSQVVNVGSADEWLSVVVEGASGLLNVSLLNVLGNPVATGGQLLSGASAAGFDMVAPPAGSYMVQVTGSVTSSTSVEISVSRTISVE